MLNKHYIYIYTHTHTVYTHIYGIYILGPRIYMYIYTNTCEVLYVCVRVCIFNINGILFCYSSLPLLSST